MNERYSHTRCVTTPAETEEDIKRRRERQAIQAMINDWLNSEAAWKRTMALQLADDMGIRIVCAGST